MEERKYDESINDLQPFIYLKIANILTSARIISLIKYSYKVNENKRN